MSYFPPYITDYPENIRKCSIDDQNLLALFQVDTGPYKREKFGYRKRTGPCKLIVKQPLVETRILLLVGTAVFNIFHKTQTSFQYFSEFTVDGYILLLLFPNLNL